MTWTFKHLNTQGGTSKDLWFEIVEMYSTCELTRESDKLIAQSGVARMFSEKVREKDDICLAELWQSKLVPSLLWLVPDGKKGDGSPSQRSPAYGSADYVAPSWSWASVRGKVAHKLSWVRVSNTYNNYSPLVDILETHLLPTDIQNPYGQVRECYSRLRGTLISSHRFFWT
jgi:hypothetical protein